MLALLTAATTIINWLAVEVWDSTNPKILRGARSAVASTATLLACLPACLSAYLYSGSGLFQRGKQSQAWRKRVRRCYLIWSVGSLAFWKQIADWRSRVLRTRSWVPCHCESWGARCEVSSKLAAYCWSLKVEIDRFEKGGVSPWKEWLPDITDWKLTMLECMVIVWTRDHVRVYLHLCGSMEDEESTKTKSSRGGKGCWSVQDVTHLREIDRRAALELPRCPQQHTCIYICGSYLESL